MNWKKEGYQKGQKAFVVSKGMFTRDVVHYNDAIIIHAGTKILKVKLEESKRILEFKDSTYSNGAFWGYGYYLYKSKEEYEKKVEEIEYKQKLKKEVTDCLFKLTIEQLEQIIQWTKEEG